MKKTLLVIAMGLGLSLLTACGTLDGGGNGSINLGKVSNVISNAGAAMKDYTPEEEEAIGNQLTAGLLGATPLVKDPALQRYVNQVGRWVAQQSDKPDLNWRFGVTDDPDVNSFAMPGGYVVISRGMFMRLNSEAELAAALGHEITHLTKGHNIRAIKAEARKQAMAGTAQVAADAHGKNDAKLAANLFSGTAEVLTRRLDKNDEYEADVNGMVLAARAGYNPFALLNVLSTIGNISPSDGAVQTLFSTHPSPRERQENIELAVGDKLDAFGSGINNTSAFLRMHKKVK